MSNDILVITEHMDGKFSDVSFELVGKAKELASALGGQAVAVVVGGGVDANVFASDATIHIDDAALGQFNPEAYGKVIEALVKEKSPRLVMFGWTATGMDLAAWLSAKLGVPCAAYVKEIGSDLTMGCQAYGGKLMADVAPETPAGEGVPAQRKADQMVPIERVVPNPDQPRRPRWSRGHQ